MTRLRACLDTRHLPLALHKNDAADAHVSVPFDEYAAVRPQINAVPGSPMFK